MSYHHISSTFKSETLHWRTLLCHAIPCSAFPLPCFGLLCCFALRFSFSGVPYIYAALLCPHWSICSALPYSSIPLWHALLCFAYLTLPCSSWLWSVLICSAQLCPALHYPALVCPALPCHTLLCFALHCPALPYHAFPPLPCSSFRCFVMLCPALLCLLHIVLVPNSPWRAISFHVSLWYW